MIRRPPRATQSRSSAASDVYKRQRLLFGLPLLLGGVIVGVVSMLLLVARDRRGQQHFESVIVALLVIITVGFVSGLVVSPPEPGAVGSGRGPRFAGTDRVLLATSMLR